MDIYSILSSKPHNSHYLNRYITFIEHCQQLSGAVSDYSEKHHICPKSMFSQYSSFVDYPWNCVTLTARQHFIAHMMLWKIYRNRSMTRAFGLMSCNYSLTSRLYESIKSEYSSLISEQMKDTVSVKGADGKVYRTDKDEFDKNPNLRGHTYGMTYAVDGDGNGYYVKKDDMRFKTGELKGNNSGRITITDGISNKRILPDDTIPNGWHRGMTKDSARGSMWINDGKTSKMYQGNIIPDGWTEGRIFDKPPRHVGTTGKISIHDGNKNRMIEKTEPIPEGWVRGRLFTK